MLTASPERGGFLLQYTLGAKLRREAAEILAECAGVGPTAVTLIHFGSEHLSPKVSLKLAPKASPKFASRLAGITFRAMKSISHRENVEFILLPGQHLIGFFLSNTLSAYYAIQHALH